MLFTKNRAPSRVHIHGDAPSNAPRENLTGKPRQIAERGIGGDRVKTFAAERVGYPGPCLAALGNGAVAAFDPDQPHAAQEKGDEGRAKAIPSGETARGDDTTFIQ